ncbi:MAG: hypothetical protein ACTHNH_08595 [Mesorhizobium sp.]
MPRKLDLTARQVTALCKGAARAGYIPIVQIGDVTIRLVPEIADLAGNTHQGEPDEQLNEWESSIADRPRLPIWGRKTALYRSDKVHRDSGETDTQRAIRHAKVLAQWESELHGSELEHRERRVMDQLLSKPAEPQHVSTIAMAGPVTVDRLVLRGFVEVTKSEKGETEMLTLTSAGRTALAEIERRRRKYPYF